MDLPYDIARLAVGMFCYGTGVDDVQIGLFRPWNDSLLADILANCQGNTELCIAANITMPDAYIRTKTIDGWKREIAGRKDFIGKRPCVFLILAH